MLIILFSQYLRHVAVPFPTYSKDRKLHTSQVYIFQILPVCRKYVGPILNVMLSLKTNGKDNKCDFIYLYVSLGPTRHLVVLAYLLHFDGLQCPSY